MKNIIFIIITVLLFLSCATIKSKATMGYDLVSWGSSVSTVKNIYNICDDIQPKTSPNAPDMLELKQENFSDIIFSRTFIFFENKLVIVLIVYNDKSDDNLRKIQAELENKFGGVTDIEEDLTDIIATKTLSFSQHSPELLVKLTYGIDQKSEIINGILVSYFWEKGIGEYLKSFKMILSSLQRKTNK